MRKRIALDVAHGQCDPKITHCDIKASNILLDKYLEAIVEDFGLGKLVDHGVSHVVTTIRGTLGCIPPESLMTSHVSEKTDVFAFGLMLIELVTGRETLELHETEYHKGGILEWVIFLSCVCSVPYFLFYIKELVSLACSHRKGFDISMGHTSI